MTEPGRRARVPRPGTKQPPPAGWERYYAVVRRIPRGRVTTYGRVAQLAGAPRTARHVGWALAALRGREASGIPWQRVLGTKGRGFAVISLPAAAGGTQQRRLLAKEGVRFDARGRVDLARHGWTG